jgi:hypothetical protein
MKEASEGLNKGSSLVWPFVQDRTGQDRTIVSKQKNDGRVTDLGTHLAVSDDAVVESASLHL